MRAMPIVRSRTGCFTCRRRKKKCNEEKPLCSGCMRNHLECTWPTSTCNTLQTRAKPASKKLATTYRQCPASPADTEPDQNQDQDQDGTRSSPVSINYHRQKYRRRETEALLRTHTQSRSSSISTSDPARDKDMTASEADATSPVLTPVSPVTSHITTTTDHRARTPYHVAISGPEALAVSTGVISLAVPISLLPSHGVDSSDLLTYYLTRTANSMGNGSTDVNPFIAKLVPIAFSNPLVLQLLLAQSASHRQSFDSGAVETEVAHRYYTDSLRMFRNAVGDYVSGKEENTLALTIGCLVMCLTEVARGDIHGTIFDHLRASELMLNLWLNQPKSEIPDDLPNFLVEFIIHMTATSIMSTNPKRAPPDLSPTIEFLARSLILKGYVGQLSGCWLELLMLIPQVHRLGHRIMTIDGKLLSHADDIITFGLLQSQIMAFSPDLAVNPYSRLAGLVFRQGLLLYLWSILGTPHGNRGNTAHADLMSSAVAEAVSLLGEFPATLRINTSLCWPLTVIGCCTMDPEVQNVLRTRLQAMYATIGLGNMKETLVLLEHLWAKPPQDVSPWKLAKAMQERQVWISFA